MLHVACLNPTDITLKFIEGAKCSTTQKIQITLKKTKLIANRNTILSNFDFRTSVSWEFFFF